MLRVVGKENSSTEKIKIFCLIKYFNLPLFEKEPGVDSGPEDRKQAGSEKSLQRHTQGGCDFQVFYSRGFS